MKIAIAAFLIVVGIIFLGVGYSASARAKSNDLQARLNDNGASINVKILREREEGELVSKQHEMFDALTNSIAEQAYETRATMQYCTGWLMIAAGGIVISFYRKENLVQSEV